MASSPPGCRLPVVAVVAAGRGVRPREGATRRRHEVARGQKPPRRILPARESPVDTPRFDSADPRPRLARSYRGLGGRASRSRLARCRREPIDPRRGGGPPARSRSRTVPLGRIDLDRPPGPSVRRNQPDGQAPTWGLAALPRRNRPRAPPPALVRSRHDRQVQRSSSRRECPGRNRGPYRRGATGGRPKCRPGLRGVVIRGSFCRIVVHGRASCTGLESQSCRRPAPSSQPHRCEFRVASR